MKKILNPLGILLFLVIFFNISCEPQQPTDEEFKETLADIKQEMQDAVITIDQALNAENVPLLLQKSDMALNILEEQVDAYLDETDKAVRRIDKETRDRILAIKKKIVETDFRLALLDDNKYIKRDEMLEEGYLQDTVTIRRTRPIAYRFPIITAPDDVVIRDRVQYGEEVKEELKNDLKVLKDETELFIQNSL